MGHPVRICIMKDDKLPASVNITEQINGNWYVHAQSQFIADLFSLSTNVHRTQHRVNLVASVYF